MKTGLKPELYKYLMNNENILNTMKILFNDIYILDSGKEPQNQKTSITKLIPKYVKPKVKLVN